MSGLRDIVHELETLPADKLDEAGRLIRGLKHEASADRKKLLERACGKLTEAEADQLERVIEEGCEKIDANSW